MSIYTIWGAFEIGLIFGLVALGVLISFRVLRFPDLTVDGSFPLGGAVAAVLISQGMDPFTATLIATLAGACAGVGAGGLHAGLRSMGLLERRLVLMALCDLNFGLRGR